LIGQNSKYSVSCKTYSDLHHVDWSKFKVFGFLQNVFRLFY
jgi:hypothetical protein